jgi:hypothetical protein
VSIKIIKYTLDASTTKALIAIYKAYLLRFIKLILDLAYYDSNYFNEAKENNYLINLPYLSLELFVAFPYLTYLTIIRFLVSNLLYIAAYLYLYL